MERFETMLKPIEEVGTTVRIAEGAGDGGTLGKALELR
jgi:hypothetical protein